jgi:2-oxoglutarate/2-oxoacid ferredoxin oxidoreductase subunit alpha
MAPATSRMTRPTTSMTELRAETIDTTARDSPPLHVDSEPEARLLVLGWGSSEGAIRAGVRRDAGHTVACAHLHHLNPFPANTGDVLRSFDRVLVPEMNTGQLAQILRARYLVDVESFCKVQGQPLFAGEIEQLVAERQ